MSEVIALRPEDRLAELEAVIERAVPTFIEVGNALKEIRDSRLYFETHETFENYCRERWKMSRPRAYQLIAATSVSTTVDNERQARALRAGPVTSGRRHGEIVNTFDRVVRLAERWEPTLAADLTPREARKQLTVLHKAQQALQQVIEAVEYRASTPQS